MRLVAALLLMTLAVPAAAEPSGVVVRSRLDPAEGAVIGQPVRLLVDVLFPGQMPRPPRVTQASYPGVQVFRFESQAVTIQERIDGLEYVGQRFEFELFPRRAGAFTVPGAQVTLLDPAGETAGSATAEPLRMTATTPPGIDASEPVIASTEVSARQTWSPDPAATFKAGDALVRKIEREALGVPALAMAELAFKAPAGARVYVDAPVSDDRVNRGELTGRRADKVTYVFERPGEYELPDLAQPWWDLAGQEARSEPMPGVKVKVAGGSLPTSQALGENRWRRPLLLAAAALVALLSLLFVVPRAGGAYRAWRIRRSSSEAAARRAFRAAARLGDASRTFEALQTWRRRMSQAQLAGLETDAELCAAIIELERSVFGRRAAWTREQGATLSRLVGAARPDPRRHNASFRHRSPLPPLNPPVSS